MQTPAAFEYERATSVEGAIASLERLGPEARILAGGHSLIPMMKLRLAQPEVLVDINGLTELGYLRLDGAEVLGRVGLAQRAADRAAVAHDGVGDDAFGVAEDGAHRRQIV